MNRFEPTLCGDEKPIRLAELTPPMARAQVDDGFRAHALAELAPHLPDGLINEMLRTVQAIEMTGHSQGR